MARSFIHSLIHFISIVPLQSTTTRKRSRHSTDTVPKFHAEAPQATASKGLVQGPYVGARAGFEPATFRTKGAESTNALPRPRSIETRSKLSLPSRLMPGSCFIPD